MDSQLNSLLFKRHSIRKYKDEEISAEAVKQIMEAALLSPSGKCSRPWEFILVQEEETLKELAKCKPMGAKPLEGAKLAVVVCTDPEKSETWIEDASVATTLMHLQAAALGVGSCWIQIRGREDAEGEPSQNLVKSLLNIPDQLQVVAILSLGMPDETRKPVDPEKLQWEKVHINNF